MMRIKSFGFNSLVLRSLRVNNSMPLVFQLGAMAISTKSYGIGSNGAEGNNNKLKPLKDSSVGETLPQRFEKLVKSSKKSDALLPEIVYLCEKEGNNLSFNQLDNIIR